MLKTWRINGSRFLAEVFGGWLTTGASADPLVSLTYGPSIAVDASLGNAFVCDITNNVAFTIQAPTNPPPTGSSQVITLTFRNVSGAAHGAGTFGAGYKTSAAFPAIANGFSRTFCFRWNGTNWVEQWRTAADVAN
jgi:hypothetical protein